ncbi:MULTISPECIES: DUF2185 domain-containing protein [Bacillus]|uniref:DUF2185 domain-containing protein n=1 Tax=Bacillus TaxID=1386 RepID=UPI000BED307D|nr:MULTISPECIES: DUF2185 domain-containing protein [Bacillus]MCX2824561.1 DUF2185 domain-containing protein [Bacillus sp. DHT2]MDR4915707.1 DUF2185 domain-containing protein [Bacillus pseudomycoides]MED4651988.1 DUF2185 domain-containing protein [Bacillus pseudomycoides]PEE07071.1 hypothetical protein CON86_04510 [Bacillus pseudomycoides]PEM78972.1 hypothetical protein CN632_05825 [Bacillus pseudomycoides]
MSNYVKSEFIKHAGGCIVSKNILDGNGKLKWLVRDESVNSVDNGWRFFSDIDDDDYVNDPNNLVVCDFNTVAQIEPAILAVYSFPVGSDLQLVVENGKCYFIDNITEEVIEFLYH